jgi:hypothetical protein
MFQVLSLVCHRPPSRQLPYDSRKAASGCAVGAELLELGDNFVVPGVSGRNGPSYQLKDQ